MPKTFFTGSRVYGSPTTRSDVDLVLLCSAAEFATLKQAKGSDLGSGYPDSSRSKSLRFDKLNLIATPHQDVFDAWREARDRCMAEAPCSRDRAVEIHKEVFRERGTYPVR